MTVLGAPSRGLQPVLYPKFLDRRLELNPLVVALSLLIWGIHLGRNGPDSRWPMTGMMKIIFDQVDRLRPYGEWLGD
jgi:predicted PurR-regulated permease PerM